MNRTPSLSARNRPRISVVVPGLGNARLVGETVESVVGDQRDLELQSLIDGYEKRHEIRLGAGAGGRRTIPSLLNAGARKARGEYFAWVNPGEVLDSARFQIQADFLDARPRTGLVHTAFASIDARGARGREFHTGIGGDGFVRLLDGDFINPNTALIRRSILGQIGPFVETGAAFPELWRAAAYRHWLRIALRSEIGYVDQVLHGSRGWSPNLEYSRPSLGKTLERAFIADCFEQEDIIPMPEIVAALFGRGLVGVAIGTFRGLVGEDRNCAIELMSAAGIDADWFVRHSRRWSVTQTTAGFDPRTSGGPAAQSMRVRLIR